MRTKYNKSYKNIKQILKNSTQTCFLEEIFFFILKHFHSFLWEVHFFQTKVSFTQLGEMERLSKITWNIQKCVMFCNERKFLQNFLFFTLKDGFFFRYFMYCVFILEYEFFSLLFHFSPLSGFDLLRLHSWFILDNVFFLKLLILKYLDFFLFSCRVKMPCEWHVIQERVAKNLILKKFLRYFIWNISRILWQKEIDQMLF